jgi:heat shock protein HslJ
MTRVPPEPMLGNRVWLLMRLLFLIAAAAASACTDPTAPQRVETPDRAPTEMLVDDGAYLRSIDPLGGQWRVERVGKDDFTVHDARIDFSAGGFLNHSAGCSGGYPAFYRLSGEQLMVTRLEPIRIGKCSPAAPEARTKAAASEQQLAAFLDQVATWSQPDDRTLVLTGKDGTEALLTRPIEPHPELAGRWRIESIGDQPLVTERRPPTLSISMGGIGAYADCNSMGGSFTIPAPGRIVVAGPMISTAIGCLPEDAAEDDLMAQAMTSATAYQLQGDRLVFTGGPGMTLRRPPLPNRELAGEYEACGNTLLGGYHEGPITLAIDSQKMRDNAGCTAAYTAEGPRLTLRLEADPACANPAPPFEPGRPTGIGGHISVLAVAQPDGFGFDDEGRLILRTARGLLTMCRKGDPPPFGG